VRCTTKFWQLTLARFPSAETVGALIFRGPRRTQPTNKLGIFRSFFGTDENSTPSLGAVNEVNICLNRPTRGRAGYHPAAATHAVIVPPVITVVILA
jgi:hypothetical protein